MARAKVLTDPLVWSLDALQEYSHKHGDDEGIHLSSNFALERLNECVCVVDAEELDKFFLFIVTYAVKHGDDELLAKLDEIRNSWTEVS